MESVNYLRGFGLPYPDYHHGFWGEPTSTLNFCEEVSKLPPHDHHSALY